jgi:hypothetical protein
VSRKKTLVICTKAPIPGFAKTRLAADAHRLHGLPEQLAMRNAAIVYGEMLDRVLADARPEANGGYDVQVYVLYPSHCMPAQIALLEERIATLLPAATLWRQPVSSSAVGVRVRLLSLLMQRLARHHVILTGGSCVGFTRSVCGELFALLDTAGGVFLRSDSEGHAAFALDMARGRFAQRVFTLLDAATRLLTDSAAPGPTTLDLMEREKRGVASRMIRGGSEMLLTRFLFGAGRAFGVDIRSMHGLAGATIRDVDYLDDLQAVMPEAIPALLGAGDLPTFWSEYVRHGSSSLDG